jgi:hypothetical protein
VVLNLLFCISRRSIAYEHDRKKQSMGTCFVQGNVSRLILPLLSFHGELKACRLMYMLSPYLAMQKDVDDVRRFHRHTTPAI